MSLLNNIVGSALDASGFATSPPPSKSGFGIRQSRVPSMRDGRLVRNMIRWFVPETGIVEMYINPQSITYTDKKHLSTPVRTKGGYILQYWGEQLGALAIQGTTGSSGIEGINVLYDVYRAEQLAFDPYALALAAKNDDQDNKLSDVLDLPSSSIAGTLLGAGEAIGRTAADTVFDTVKNIIDTGSPTATRQKPTLASLAFSVEMYWSGWVFRGFFNDFVLNEKANELGLFDYTMNFTYTQRRGIRYNFMPWHRSATDGPSDTDPVYGRPYSYDSSIDLAAKNYVGNVIAPSTTIFTAYDQLLKSQRAIMGNPSR
jgi:hypothetical protein